MLKAGSTSAGTCIGHQDAVAGLGPRHGHGVGGQRAHGQQLVHTIVCRTRTLWCPTLRHSQPERCVADAVMFLCVSLVSLLRGDPLDIVAAVIPMKEQGVEANQCLHREDAP
jgi:hypothetical protein